MVWIVIRVMWQLSYGGPAHVGEKEEEEECEGKAIDHSESYAREILQLLQKDILKYPIGKR